MASQNILRFKEEWGLKVPTQITKVKMVIFKGLATQHPVKLVGILALGALLMGGTAVQFAPGPDESGSNPSLKKVQAHSKPTDVGAVDSDFRFTDIDAVDDPLLVEDLLTYVYPEAAIGGSYEQQRAADSLQERIELREMLNSMAVRDLVVRSNHEQQRAERLEVQRLQEDVQNRYGGVRGPSHYQQRSADSVHDVTRFFGEDVAAALGYELLIARLDHFQADGPMTSRKMERLDHEIDTLLIAAEPGGCQVRRPDRYGVGHRRQ
jgi:hypothetical protein